MVARDFVVAIEVIAAWQMTGPKARAAAQRPAVERSETDCIFWSQGFRWLPRAGSLCNWPGRRPVRPRSGLLSSGARLSAYFGLKVFDEGPCGRAAACCRAERVCCCILWYEGVLFMNFAYYMLYCCIYYMLAAFYGKVFWNSFS